MTSRKLNSRLKYLRNLYAELEEISENAKTENGKIRSLKAADYLKCAVCLLIDTYELEFKN